MVSLLASPPLTRKRWGRRATRCPLSVCPTPQVPPAPHRAVGRGIKRGAAHFAFDVAAGRAGSAATARSAQVFLSVHEHALLVNLPSVHSPAIGRRARRRWRPGADVPPSLHPTVGDVPRFLDRRRRWPMLDGVCAAHVRASVLLERGEALLMKSPTVSARRRRGSIDCLRSIQVSTRRTRSRAIALAPTSGQEAWIPRRTRLCTTTSCLRVARPLGAMSPQRSTRPAEAPQAGRREICRPAPVPRGIHRAREVAGEGARELRKRCKRRAATPRRLRRFPAIGG